MSEAFSVLFHFNKTLLHKNSWVINPGPKAKSSSKITNLNPFIVSYHLGGSGIFRTRSFNQALTEIARLRQCRSGQEELSHVQGQGRQPRGATPQPRLGAAAETSYPMTEVWQLHGCRWAKRSYSTFKVRRGNLVQGKEHWLHFAGAAVKRYPTTKVRETQVRW